MTKMLVYFECFPADIGTILGAIGENMVLVTNLRVETENLNTRTRRKAIEPVKGMGSFPYQNSRVLAVVMNCFNNHPKVSVEHFKTALEHAGLSRNSITPILTHIKRAGVAQKNADGTWSKIQGKDDGPTAA